MQVASFIAPPSTSAINASTSSPSASSTSASDARACNDATYPANSNEQRIHCNPSVNRSTDLAPEEQFNPSDDQELNKFYAQLFHQIGATWCAHGNTSEFLPQLPPTFPDFSEANETDAFKFRAIQTLGMDGIGKTYSPHQWVSINDSSVSETVERLHGLLNSSWDCQGKTPLLAGEPLQRSQELIRADMEKQEASLTRNTQLMCTAENSG